MKTEKEISGIIATINDAMVFACGRRLIPDEANVAWREFVGDDRFDYRLFVEAVKGYFSDGGTYIAEVVNDRIRAIYFRMLAERRSGSRKRNCICSPQGYVWIALDKRGGVWDFVSGDPGNFGGVAVAVCPFCSPSEYSPEMLAKVKARYRPWNIKPGDDCYMQEGGGAIISGREAIQFCLHRLAALKMEKEATR